MSLVVAEEVVDLIQGKAVVHIQEEKQDHHLPVHTIPVQKVGAIISTHLAIRCM